jgi:hypothetical protein
MAVIWGGALGRSLHGGRSCGSRQLKEQNRRLARRGFAVTGAMLASPFGDAQAAALTGQS